MSKKKRNCPVVGKEIPSAECGAKRLSQYDCPESCPFNPFSAENYDQSLEIESIVDGLSIKRLREESERGQWRLDSGLERAIRRGDDDFIHGLMTRELFFRQDASGKTFSQHWDDTGLPGLKNEQRVLFRGKMQVRVALIEAQQIHDHQRVTAIDLLDPGRKSMLIVDRSYARMACRFTPTLSWIYPMPHFWRLHGSAIILPVWSEYGPVEIISEIACHQGGPPEGEALRRWLVDHWQEIAEAVEATGQARLHDMLTGVDAQWVKSVYQIRGTFEQCLKRLETFPEMERGDLSSEEIQEGFLLALDCYCPASDGISDDANAKELLGRILVRDSTWRLEAMGRARSENFKEVFEKQMVLK